ncbi:MAG: beta-galactosidase [Rhodospirillales bacterium]|nr:beta-galactosidase [Rhodospirillales bacterium]
MAKHLRTLALLAAWWPASSLADRIEVPAPGLARDRPASFTYHLDQPQTGTGMLAIEWSDVHGRVVERRRQPVTLTGGASIEFTLDLRRAAAMKNTVSAELTLDAIRVSGAAARHAGAAKADFIATPDDDPWRDYQVIMWHGRTAEQYAGLKAIGISAGMVIPWRADPGQEMTSPHIAAMLQNDLRWYIENSATDFYAAYHRWTPGKPVNWLYEEARRLYRANPQDLAARIREPSLEDPAWRATVAERMHRIVGIHRPYAPLYYSLADEAGIADLSANWDFDFGPQSLAGFRDWLRGRYGTLAALNRQWGARHASWDAIVPPTTTEAMRRRDQNYSAWSDFKDWMNVSFAEAVRHGRDAVRGADPRALAAIEGTQVSGWGGYDYARLAPTVDLIEIYEVAGNVDVMRSFNPTAVRIKTSFDPPATEEFWLWQHWLRGGRGALLWDEDHSFVDQAGKPGPRGQGHAAQFRELRDGLGALLINADQQVDPIAVLYSPPSFRARWMLDYRHLGHRWIERDAEREHEDPTALRTATSGFLAAVRGAGYQPYVIDEAAVEQGLVGANAPKVLVLPHVLALSDAAAAAIGRFVAGGGRVVADIVPGEFDQHVRRRSAPILADLFNSESATLVDPAGHPGAVAALRRSAAAAGLAPYAALTDDRGQPTTGVELVRYTSGEATILAILPLAQGPQGTLRIALPGRANVHEARKGVDHGAVDRLSVALPDRSPAILVSSPRAPAAPTLSVPARITAGTSAALAIEPAIASGRSVIRFAVIDPSGRRHLAYSGNLVLPSGRASHSIPFAVNDPPGRWTIRATEILTGRSAEAVIDLAPARTP